MADIMSILSNTYSVQTPITAGKYVNVDAEAYQGTWQGKYSDNSKFSLTISEISGFRAQVKYTNGATVKYQQVLIKDDTFRIGDSKFFLDTKHADKATIKTIVTNPVTGGSTMDTAAVTRS
jgi:hypothetical protein